MMDQEKAKAWEASIEQWKKSGLNRREWCHQQNIPYHQFKYWWQRLNATPKTRGQSKPTTENTNWIRVSVPPGNAGAESQSSAALTVRVKPHEVSVDIREGARAETVRMVLEVLQSLCST